MTLTLNEQSSNRLKHVARQTGISQEEVVDKALDIFLFAKELQSFQRLQEETDDWQNLYFETLALEDERLAQLEHDKGRNLD